VVVRRTVRVRRHIPAGAEDEEVGEGRRGIARGCCEDAEDGGVDVVDADGADVDELGEVVFVGHVISVPGDYIEGAVVLGRLEELAAELVGDFPGRFLDFVGGDGIEEIACVGEAVGA
jgi:hypothetical protein